MDNELYEMKLHEEISIYSGLNVMRVPGGWIYKSFNEQVGGAWSESSVFVPFDNEFCEGKRMPEFVEKRSLT